MVINFKSSQLSSLNLVNPAINLQLVAAIISTYRVTRSPSFDVGMYVLKGNYFHL
jgi:hypothetical protein